MAPGKDLPVMGNYHSMKEEESRSENASVSAIFSGKTKHTYSWVFSYLVTKDCTIRLSRPMVVHAGE